MAPALAEAPALPSASGRALDLAFGAYQRGFYVTAHSLALRRVQDFADVKAMTLLGELYANGHGVVRDDAEAAIRKARRGGPPTPP